jgi:hypothetical protein
MSESDDRTLPARGGVLRVQRAGAVRLAVVALLAVVVALDLALLWQLDAGGLPDCMPCPDEVVRSVPQETTP